jgi:hypothetical protein
MPMTVRDHVADTAGLVRGIAADAVARQGVSEAAARRASAATIRKFCAPAGACVAASDVARLRSYFWGVVRRTALSGRVECGPLRDRYLISAYIDDLRQGGHGAEHIVEEVTRRFGDAVPPALLERMRPAAPLESAYR